MIKISDTVHTIIENDSIALEALQKGILNMSAYAHIIHDEVEKRAMKDVVHGSIVVALSRLEKRYQNMPELRPYVDLKNVSVKGRLAEVTYEKTLTCLHHLSTLNTTLFSEREFFAITEGLAEVTIICPEAILHSIKSHIAEKPKAAINNLVAVSVSFSEAYLNVPNSIYTFISALAARRINLVEVVSTYTELSFIIHGQDLERTLASLRKYLHNTI